MTVKTTAKTYYSAYRLVALTPHGTEGSVSRLERDPTVAVFDPADIGKPEVAKGRILQHPFPLLPPPPGGWDRKEWEQMRTAILALDPAAADAMARLDDRGCLRRSEKPADAGQGMTHLAGLTDPAQMQTAFGDAPVGTDARPVVMSQADAATAEKIAAAIGRTSASRPE